MASKRTSTIKSEGVFAELISGSAVQQMRVFRAIAESLGEGLVVTDQTNRILFVNERTIEMTRFRREQLIGAKTDEVFLSPEQWQENERRLNERLSGQAETYEIEQLCGDGQRHWFQVRATPFRDEPGEIIGTIGVMLDIEERRRLEIQNELLQEELRQVINSGSIIGGSPAIRKCLEQVRLVASTDATVLVTGESGTGKELVARAIHELSSRRDASLVRVNCASIPKELFESEFFGHVRGAFTGAVKDRSGRFELAHKGTLFLDEIGEVPLEHQSKLLRVLQEGTFERVGEERTRTVDVRIIAATNRNLLSECENGHFRRDLYYRLSVFPIEVPPLRDRTNDVIALAQHFIERAVQKLRVAPPKLTQAQARELLQYGWPGNVRELQHVIERAVILSRGGRMQLNLDASAKNDSSAYGQIKNELGSSAGNVETGETLPGLKIRERDILLRALRETRWKINGANGAAAILGLAPTTLHNKMRKYGLERHGEVYIAEKRNWEER